MVFSTKERLNTIPAELQPKLWAYIGGIARRNQIAALAIGGTPNHVHMLIDLPATMPIAKAVQLIKGGSSKWLHDTTGTRFEWQDGYGAFTVSVSHKAATVHYILGQAEHHRRHDYQEEFRAFLKKHGIVRDESHLWG